MNNKNPIKIMTNKHIVGSLALSGLLLATTGCNSLVNTKAAQPVTNIPSLPDKTKEQPDSKPIVKMTILLQTTLLQRLKV